MKDIIKQVMIAFMLLIVSVTAKSQDVVEYIHTDALGSPVAITNQAGQVIERMDHEPYGKLIGKANNDRPGYTGHVMDSATGLTYMQQRYYDPLLGRFLSTDPVQANANTGASFNRYAYASNNPYKFTDPDGRQDCHACDKFNDQYKKDAETGNSAVWKPFERPAIAVTIGMLGPLAYEGSLGILARPQLIQAGTSLVAELGGVTGYATGGGALLHEAHDILMPGGRLIGEVGKNSGIRILQGDPKDAAALFNKLTQGGIPRNESGSVVQIGENAFVGFRYSSKSGPPTVDINIPGIKIREIKFKENQQ